MSKHITPEDAQFLREMNKRHKTPPMTPEPEWNEKACEICFNLTGHCDNRNAEDLDAWRVEYIAAALSDAYSAGKRDGMEEFRNELRDRYEAIRDKPSALPIHACTKAPEDSWDMIRPGERCPHCGDKP